MYHAVVHQAGFVPANCKGDSEMSMALRRVALAMTHMFVRKMACLCYNG